MRDALPTAAGCAGSTVALLNVYPTLYPWHTSSEKVFGIAVCGLLSALGARTLHLAVRDQMDGALLVLCFALFGLVAIGAICAIDSSAAATPVQPPAPSSGANRARGLSVVADSMLGSGPPETGPRPEIRRVVGSTRR